jgi:hypothetical protein
MSRKGRIARYSADQLAVMRSDTNWAKADAVPQEEVERLADEEEGPLPAGWEDTIILGTPEPKAGRAHPP